MLIGSKLAPKFNISYKVSFLMEHSTNVWIRFASFLQDWNFLNITWAKKCISKHVDLRCSLLRKSLFYIFFAKLCNWGYLVRKTTSEKPCFFHGGLHRILLCILKETSNYPSLIRKIWKWTFLPLYAQKKRWMESRNLGFFF